MSRWVGTFWLLWKATGVPACSRASTPRQGGPGYCQSEANIGADWARAAWARRNRCTSWRRRTPVGAGRRQCAGQERRADLSVVLAPLTIAPCRP